jgi:hypothetical protein
MKTSMSRLIKPILFLFSLLVFGCIKDTPKVNKIETTTVTDITATTAKAGLEFIDLSGHVTEFGHCWNTVLWL